jgi:hypothetical protein
MQNLVIPRVTEYNFFVFHREWIDITYVDLRSDIHKVVHTDFKEKVHFQFSMFYAENIVQLFTSLYLNL